MAITLELHDIQSGALRPRPSPYAAVYLGLRIDDARSGRELVRRAASVVNSAADAESRTGDAWTSISLTYTGLKACAAQLEPLVRRAEKAFEAVRPPRSARAMVSPT